MKETRKNRFDSDWAVGLFGVIDAQEAEDESATATYRTVRTDMKRFSQTVCMFAKRPGSQESVEAPTSIVSTADHAPKP